MKRCGGHWNRLYVIYSDSEETETTQGRTGNAGLGWALKKGQDSDRQEGLGAVWVLKGREVALPRPVRRVSLSGALRGRR